MFTHDFSVLFDKEITPDLGFRTWQGIKELYSDLLELSPPDLYNLGFTCKARLLKESVEIPQSFGPYRVFFERMS